MEYKHTGDLVGHTRHYTTQNNSQQTRLDCLEEKCERMCGSRYLCSPRPECKRKRKGETRSVCPPNGITEETLSSIQLFGSPSSARSNWTSDKISNEEFVRHRVRR